MKDLWSVNNYKDEDLRSLRQTTRSCVSSGRFCIQESSFVSGLDFSRGTQGPDDGLKVTREESKEEQDLGVRFRRKGTTGLDGFS